MRRGAPREGRPPPAARLGRAGRARRCSSAVVEAVAELLARRARARSSPAGSTTRASRCSPGTPRRGEPLTPDRRLAGQALAGGARPARADGARTRSRRAQRAAARPLLLGRQARLAARARRGGGARARRGHAADGHGRLVPLRPARRRLRHRPLDRVAHAAAALGAPGWDPALLEIFGVPREVAARDRATPPATSARCATRAWPVELPLRARGRRPAGGARRRGLRRARAASRRPTAPACSCSPTSATSVPRRPAACCRRSPGGSAAGSSTRSTAASSPPARCSSGSAASSASPPTRPRSARSPREAEDCGGVRVLPGARRARRAVVAPDARAVIAGLDGGTTRARTSRAPRSRAIAWRVADIVEAIRETRRRRRPARRRRPDQRAAAAPAAGRRDRRAGRGGGGRRDRAGAAALAAVGAGRARLARRGRRAAAGRPSASSPSRDADWRAAEHERWREFVAATAALDSL